MTDHNKENEEKLSFKDQILRDLKRTDLSKNQQLDSDEMLHELGTRDELEEQPLSVNDASQSTDSSLDQLFTKEVNRVESQEPKQEEAYTRKLSVSYRTDSQPVTENIPQEDLQTSSQEDLLFEQAEQLSQPDDVKTSLPTQSLEKEQTVQPSAFAAPREEPKEELVTRSRAKHAASKYHKAKKKNKIVSRIVWSVTVLVLLGVAVTGFMAYHFVSSGLEPVNAKDTKYVTVEIPKGSGNKQVGTVLEKAGLIKSAQIFNFYTKFKNYGNFQSGYYNLQKSMDLDTIAKKLEEGGTDTPQPPVIGRVTIPEGYTIDQIAQTVTVNAASKKKEKTPFKADAFLKAIQDDAFINREIAKYPQLLGSLPAKDTGVKYRLEGYLFPATYNYGQETTVEDLIDQMLATMNQTMTNYYGVLTSKNLTVNEALTIASLVEKEGATDTDRKNIASVFYNRLNQGMPLQSNIAILYAQGKLGQKTSLAEDAAINTEIDSPYNVYKNTGLMPGAVDNPGKSAIEAAINPNKTDYLYFVANVETGNVYFAQTFEEHSKNVEEHVNSKLTKNSSSN